MCFNLKRRFIILPLLIMSLSHFTFARFNFVKGPDGQWNAETVVQKGDGLGQLLREIGVEPNWNSKLWIKEIQAKNSTLVEKNGWVLSPGKKLIIPIHSLKECQGYPKLLVKLNSDNHLMKKQKSAYVPSLSPRLKREVASQKKRYDTFSTQFSVLIGAGLSQIPSEDGLGNDTKINSELSQSIEAKMTLNFNSKFGLSFYGKGNFVNYKAPSGITFNQESKSLFGFGGEALFHITQTTKFGLFAESKGVHLTNFLLTSLDLESPQVLTGGVSFSMGLLHFASSGLFLELRPHYLFSGKESDYEYKGGFGHQARIFYSPLDQYQGLIVGLEHLYQSQSLENSANNKADQTFQQGLFFLGYQF